MVGGHLLHFLLPLRLPALRTAGSSFQNWVGEAHLCNTDAMGWSMMCGLLLAMRRAGSSSRRLCKVGRGMTCGYDEEQDERVKDKESGYDVKNAEDEKGTEKSAQAVKEEHPGCEGH